MTVTISTPATHASAGIDSALSVSQAQGLVTPLLDQRYRVVAPLGDPDASSASPVWRTYLAEDTALHRKVVLRVAVRTHGRADDLHARVRRALHGAQLNAHLVAQVYDAVLADQHAELENSATSAVIICQYFEGITLHEAIRRGLNLDRGAILGALARRVADAAEAGISFGSLRSDSVVLTSEGPAIACLPVGAVSRIGPTSLDALAASMGTRLFNRTRRGASWSAPRHARRA